MDQLQHNPQEAQEKTLTTPQEEAIRAADKAQDSFLRGVEQEHAKHTKAFPIPQMLISLL